MQYWIVTIGLFIAVVVIGIFIWKKSKKEDAMADEDFRLLIVLGSLVLLCLIPFAIDLPSALSGGQEIYVNELPTRYDVGTFLSFVETDNEQLKHLKLGEWEKYEKHGNYRIKHTKPIKFVLDIEPLD